MLFIPVAEKANLCRARGPVTAACGANETEQWWRRRNGWIVLAWSDERRWWWWWQWKRWRRKWWYRCSETTHRLWGDGGHDQQGLEPKWQQHPQRRQQVVAGQRQSDDQVRLMRLMMQDSRTMFRSRIGCFYLMKICRTHQIFKAIFNISVIHRKH